MNATFLLITYSSIISLIYKYILVSSVINFVYGFSETLKNASPFTANTFVHLIIWFSRKYIFLPWNRKLVDLKPDLNGRGRVVLCILNVDSWMRSLRSLFPRQLVHSTSSVPWVSIFQHYIHANNVTNAFSLTYWVYFMKRNILSMKVLSY